MIDERNRRREARLIEDLSRLRRQPAPEVSVRERVLARVGRAHGRRLGAAPSWLALAASVALAAGLGMANAATLPSLPGAVRDLAPLASPTRAFVVGMAGAATRGAFATISEAISELIGLTIVVLDLLERHAWLWKPVLLVAFGAACLSAAVFLYREFRRAPSVDSFEETRHDA